MTTNIKYVQGFAISNDDPNLAKAVKAAVDYRGDITLELTDGTTIEGYLFNFYKNTLDIYPKNENNKLAIPITQIKNLSFSGKDTADGKSWEAWMAKKEAEKKNKLVEQKA